MEPRLYEFLFSKSRIYIFPNLISLFNPSRLRRLPSVKKRKLKIASKSFNPDKPHLFSSTTDGEFRIAIFQILRCKSKIYSRSFLLILNPHINSWSHRCMSFSSRNPESTHARILFCFLTHLDFVVCLRSKNESCRDRRNLSIPTNLTSFHPPQPENFVSQYFRSYGVNPRSTRARFFKSKFLWWEGRHLDFVVCLRSKNESCRDRRNLSIPTNLTSFHPPQPENFVSQYFRSYGVNPRSTRARFFKSKFLWWEGRNNNSPQLSCSEFFDLTYGFVSLTQIYFLSILSQNHSPQLSCSEFFNLTYGFVSLAQIYFLSILRQNRVNLFF